MKKFLTLAAMMAIFSNAHASFFATTCSDSYGNVTWSEGHTSNTITFKYYSNAGKKVTKTLPLQQVNIAFGEKNVMKSETVSDCAVAPMYSKTTVYAAPVTITGLDRSDLDMKQGDKLETFVICEYHMNSMMACPRQK